MHCPHHGGEALVHRLDRLDRRLDHAGVAHHVRVGEVDDPEAVVALPPVRGERVGRRPGAHLGLVVVGGDVAWRVDEVALLARVLVLLAAVEEVGDVRVLLRFGHVQLRGALAGEG